jgi:hypothetical protein
MLEDTTVANEKATNIDNEKADQNQKAAFQRLQAKNAELEAKLKEKEETETPPKEKKVDPTDIYSIVRNELLAQSKIDSEISTIMGQYPSLNTEDNKTKIENYLKDDSRKNIPVQEVVAGAIGIDALISLGASIGSDAIALAKQSDVGGDNAEGKAKTTEQKREQAYMDSLPAFAK